MPHDHDPLSGDEIRRHLGEIADELAAAGSQHRVIIVGGALLALHDLRLSTYDIDSVTPVDAELRNAAARVAARHGLGVDWLNDHARSFTPLTLDHECCEVLFEGARLVVLGAPFDQVFVMKLYRGSPQDVEDMVAIWNRCAFDSPQDAVALFERAYPQVLDDPHLVDFVGWIADRAHGRASG